MEYEVDILPLKGQSKENCSSRKYEFRRRLRKRKKKCVVGEKIEGEGGGEGGEGGGEGGGDEDIKKFGV